MRYALFACAFLIACDSRPAKQETATSRSSKWAIDSEIDAIDDSRTVVLRLPADEPSAHAPALIFRCQSGKLATYIKWNQYLGLDTVTVIDRVGTAPARSMVWSLSTDNRASFSPRTAFFLMREISDSGRYIARTVPYGANPATATFDATGVRSALPALFAHCAKDTVTFSYPSARVFDSVIDACAKKRIPERARACLDDYQRRRKLSAAN